MGQYNGDVSRGTCHGQKKTRNNQGIAAGIWFAFNDSARGWAWTDWTVTWENWQVEQGA